MAACTKRHAKYTTKTIQTKRNHVKWQKAAAYAKNASKAKAYIQRTGNTRNATRVIKRSAEGKRNKKAGKRQPPEEGRLVRMVWVVEELVVAAQRPRLTDQVTR